MCLKKIRSWFRKPPDGSVSGDPPPEVTTDPPKIDHPDTNIKQMDARNHKAAAHEVRDSPYPEFRYIQELIRYRINKYFGRLNEDEPFPDFPPYEEWKLPMADYIQSNIKEISQDAATLLLIGIIPFVDPALFDEVIESTLPVDDNGELMGCRNIGGARGNNSRFFLPTGETAVFLIAGDDYERRFEVEELFGAEHIFWRRKIIWLEDLQVTEPPMNGKILVSPDYVDLLTIGIPSSPQFSISFPARRISAASDRKEEAEEPDPCKEHGPQSPWDYLVINDELKKQIDEIRTWLKYNDKLVEELGVKNRFRKGYRSLFYGPPGTGKTFTAQLLGKELDRDVYKIDLSMVVSKYIGETEKNLELLFARAENKNWILFFDEADALFGKRTDVRDAHDKYANQEVSYLLQRIEDFDGLIILATNYKSNIDNAFIRRFNSILHFPLPKAEERKLIWQYLFPENALFGDRVGEGAIEGLDIPERVKNHELTGGNINSIVHYASLKGMERRYSERVSPDCPHTGLIIYLEDVVSGIAREMIKEGKPYIA